jgi:hypothetical protein
MRQLCKFGQKRVQRCDKFSSICLSGHEHMPACGQSHLITVNFPSSLFILIRSITMSMLQSFDTLHNCTFFHIISKYNICTAPQNVVDLRECFVFLEMLYSGSGFNTYTGLGLYMGTRLALG